MLAGRFTRLAVGSCGIRHKLHQRSVGIAKVDAGAFAFGAEALQWPALDGHAASLQMRYRVRNGPVPFETKVAVAGSDWKFRHLGRIHPRTMHVELAISESIGISDRPLNELRAKHRPVERV